MVRFFLVNIVMEGNGLDHQWLLELDKHFFRLGKMGGEWQRRLTGQIFKNSIYFGVCVVKQDAIANLFHVPVIVAIK